MKKCEVILGLGSNIGNRRAHLGEAVALLAGYIEDIRASSIYESAALLPEGAPLEWDMSFYNLAVSGVTSLSPRELLVVAKQIEKKLGRNKTAHWGPREVDIDILAMGDMVINEPDLIIPHPELLKRDFALIPLTEIASGWVHPLAKKTAKDLCHQFTANGLTDCLEASLLTSSVIPAQAGIPVEACTNGERDSRLRGNDNNKALSKQPLKVLKKPALVGIVNITPDSFSDGGENYNTETALANIHNLPGQGAEVIDIGAESTRPGARPLSQAEEWARLEPVLANIKGFTVPISVDTRHARTAKMALALGAGWINDVSGFADEEMLAAVRGSDCRLVVMHSLTVPADKNIILPVGSDPVEQLLNWAEKRFSDMEKSGIDRARLIFDPGIGFGKNAEQSHTIIKDISRFRELGVPLLVGHSRKSFLHYARIDARYLTCVRDDKEDIEDKTVRISQYLADNGVDYLRVHNVRRHRLEVL